MPTIDKEAKSVIISVNPKSGASDKQAIAHELSRLLTENGLEVFTPLDRDVVREKAEQLHEQGKLRAVVAAGGDGTASWLVNTLDFSFPLAILPLGTENLLAKYLGLTKDTHELCRIITNGHFANLDVGRANDRYFLVMCSCGFDADVVKRLHSVREGHINHWSYAKPIIDAISRYRYPTLRIRVDHSDEVIKSKWAFIFNIPRYAMNLQFIPDADSMDGKLDLCTFRGGNLLRGLFYLGGVIFRQHRNWKDTHFANFSTLTIESDDPVPYQIDGDPGGELPLELRVIPRYLKAIVDESWIKENVSSESKTTETV